MTTTPQQGHVVGAFIVGTPVLVGATGEFAARH
jgi:hypothetical protein